jgi:hypothetical protein
VSNAGRGSRVAHPAHILRVHNRAGTLAPARAVLGVTTALVRGLREVGYQGGKSALYALVASLRPKLAKPLVRFEGGVDHAAFYACNLCTQQGRTVFEILRAVLRSHFDLSVVSC